MWQGLPVSSLKKKKPFCYPYFLKENCVRGGGGAYACWCVCVCVCQCMSWGFEMYKAGLYAKHANVWKTFRGENVDSMLSELLKGQDKINKLETVEMQFFLIFCFCFQVLWFSFCFMFILGFCFGFCDIIVKKEKEKKLLCNT